MANSPHLPSGNLHELRPGLAHDRTSARLRAVTPEPAASPEEPAAPISQPGPRKLVRPKLPEGFLRKRSFESRGESPILAHQTAVAGSRGDYSASSAEAFYFQKQVQTQTMMVFVLEDGEQLEGYIEWYDRDAIKIRNGKRTLIYKSAIKYLYKSGDVQGALNGLAKAR
jgi:sRNA-binding regulator protein Hfq